jgi:hypothetical protein
MLNFKKNNFITKNIYADISILYDIVDVNDNGILIKHQNSLKQVHIYKVEPIMVLNIEESICKNVINSYTEFLRGMNYDFQIYIENTKVNINNYFNNINLDDMSINKNKLAQIYKLELEKSLSENNIYIFNYYIALLIENNYNIEEINKNIYNLCKTGVSIEKLQGKDNLDSFVFSKINKVENV